MTDGIPPLPFRYDVSAILKELCECGHPFLDHAWANCCTANLDDPVEPVCPCGEFRKKEA